MRVVYLFIFIFLTFSHADEIARMESIVSDIAQLRLNYEKSQESLNICRVNLKDEKEKNTLLTQELNSNISISEKEKEYESRIKNLENQINTLKNNKKQKYIKKQVKKEEKQVCLTNQIKDENLFPKLQVKNEYGESETLSFFKPASFRANKKAPIYDAINGSQIDQWDEDTSFTSNQKTENWIKITGYFVEKVWKKALTEMWIKVQDSKQREQK